MRSPSFLMLLLCLVAFEAVAAPKIRVVATGFQFPDGPAINAAGEFFVCDVKSRGLYKVDLGTGVKERWVETGGKPTGATFAPDGRMIVADSGLNLLLEILPDGNITALFEEADRLNGPNDVAISPTSGIVAFTDPSWQEPSIKPTRVYKLWKDRFSQITGDMRSPAGLIFDREGNLFFSEAMSGNIWKVPVDKLGDSRAPEIFFHIKDAKQLDGMEVDAQGRFYVCLYGQGQIAVIGPDAKPLGRITLPNNLKPSNLEFSKDYTILYVTDADKGEILAVTQFYAL